MRLDYLAMLTILALPGCPSSGGDSDDDSGSSDDDDDTDEMAEACLDLITCVDVVAPTALTEVEEAYGPDSPCWENAAAAAVCIEACLQALETYNIGFPNVAECGENPFAPTLSNLQVQADEGMLSISVDYEDPEGDISSGEASLYVDGDLAASAEVEIQDSTEGTLDFTVSDLASIGLSPGQTFVLGMMLADRGGNESNTVEAEVTIPSA